MNWSQVALGDISELVYGKTLRGYVEIEDSENAVRVFGTNGPIGWCKSSLTDEPTVIVGRKGAYRGIHFSETPSWTIDTAFFTRIDTERVDMKWFYYRLLLVDINRLNSGAAIPSTRREDFYSVTIQLPDQDTQLRTVSILSAYDALIENNRRRIALLEEAARLLYREWFVYFRFPGHENVKISDGLPEGWYRRTLVELAEVVMGQSPKSQFYNDFAEGLPFHQGVTDYAFRFVKHRIYSTAVTKIAEAGDILVSVRAPVGRINITRDKIVLGRGLAAIRSRTEDQPFLFYALKNHFYAENIIGTGAIYAATNKKELEGQILVEPPAGLLREFKDQIDPIDLQIACLESLSDKLAQTRDLLLPRLMNGEIAV